MLKRVLASRRSRTLNNVRSKDSILRDFESARKAYIAQLAELRSEYAAKLEELSEEYSELSIIR